MFMNIIIIESAIIIEKISKMEQYTADQVADLVDDSDIDVESDSDIEEDPAFPLPTIDSDEDDHITLPSPAVSPSASHIQSEYLQENHPLNYTYT